MTPHELVQKARELRRAAIDGGEDRRDEARAFLHEAVETARSSDDWQGLGIALMALGEAERDAGRTEAALAGYQEAAKTLRVINDPMNLAHALRHLGEIRREAGHPAAAEPLYREAMTLYREATSPPLNIANSLRGLGLAQEALGQRDAARMSWLEAGEHYAAFCRDESLDVDSFAGVVEARRRVDLLAN